MMGFFFFFFSLAEKARGSSNGALSWGEKDGKWNMPKCPGEII